eukprot:3265142-Karenia_brevis.AAC.1
MKPHRLRKSHANEPMASIGSRARMDDQCRTAPEWAHPDSSCSTCSDASAQCPKTKPRTGP